MSIMENSLHEEGIIASSYSDNSYTIIEPGKMPSFPYILLGIVTTILKMTEVDKEEEPKMQIGEGVGILIGDDIVLTSGHNLYYDKSTTSLISIHFTPLINGFVQLIQPISCYNFITPVKFQDMEQDKNTDDILPYDFGVIFLTERLGSKLQELFDLSKVKQVKEVDNKTRLYRYFLETDIKEMKDIIKDKEQKGKGFIERKVSIISYTKYDQAYLNNKKFAFASNISAFFSKTNNMRYTIRKSERITSRSTRATLQYNSLFDIGSMMDESILPQQNIFQYPYYICTQEQSDKSRLNTKEKYSESSEYFDEKNNVLLCESKGRLFFELDDIHMNRNEIDYLITTYTGQSGSPIFLKQSRKSKTTQQEKYDYIFIGLHSRSPHLPPSPSEIKRSLTNKESKDNDDCPISPKRLQGNFITETGYSTHNIGLFLNMNIRRQIYNTILKMRRLWNNITQELHFNNIYYIVDFYSYEDKVMTGIFHRTTPISNLIIPIQRYFEIQQQYISLTICNEVFDFNNKKNTNHIRPLHEFSNNPTNLPLIKCDININIDYYSTVLEDKITTKLKESNTKSRDSILNKKNKELLVNSIEHELAHIKEKSGVMYGLIFNKIQSTSLQELYTYKANLTV